VGVRNFINEGDLRTRAESLAAAAPECAYARCVRLLEQQLRADPRNARPPRAKEIKAAGAWARRAEAAGQPLSWFVASSASAAMMRRFVARVRDAHADLESGEAPAHGHETVQRLECARLFANLDHMSFADIDEKTRVLARRRRRIAHLRTLRAARDVPHAPADSVAAHNGRIWRRITTTGELGRIGDALDNCTAFHRRTHAAYARRLVSGSAEFWVLESAVGDPMILLMLMAGARVIGDIRRKRNGYVSLSEPDVAAFMRARGPDTLRAPPPAPQPAPAPAPPSDPAALRSASQASSAILNRLRRTISATLVRVRVQESIASRGKQTG
jgi:hypothetical protein